MPSRPGGSGPRHAPGRITGGDLEIDLSSIPREGDARCTWLDTHSGRRVSLDIPSRVEEHARIPCEAERTFVARVQNPLTDTSSPCAIAIRTEARHQPV